jgi:hypothetical protein
LGKIETLQQNLRENSNKFVGLFGWKGIVALLFYPVITLLTTPVRLVQTLWNCRLLAEGRNWADYPHFNPQSAINSLFYWTTALNFGRFGRLHRAPNIGLGSYSVSRCFHYSFISLYAYWKAGAVALLLGMFGWWASHFLWLDVCSDITWCLSIFFLTLIGTTFYSHTFACQNYNVLGWMLMPMGLYGWATGNWALSALAWLGASFGSLTVTLLACLLSIACAFKTLSIYPVLTVFPAGVKILFHLLPNVIRGDIRTILSKTAKAIGLSRNNAKYVRKTAMNFGVRRIYRLGIYAQFVIVFCSTTGDYPILVISSLFIWIINSISARFADEESMEMLILTVSLSEVLNVPEGSLWLLISYWFLVSPLPLFARFPSLEGLAVVPVLAPVNIQPILRACGRFLEPVKRGSRILMAFDDPEGQYDKIFDGYRFLIEVPRFVASQKEVHFLPDWLAVFDVNYEGAPDFWGRDVEDVQRQMQNWDAGYVIVYQESGTQLEQKWADSGFKKLTHISWKTFEYFFEGKFPFSGPVPDWWLLQYDLEG